MKGFLDWVTEIDEDILMLINGSYNSSMDFIMALVSDRWIWIPFYLLLLYLLIKKTGVKKGLFYLLIIVLLIAVVDQTCASLFRPLVGRLRPSSLDNPLSQYIRIVNEHRGGSYGFPSAHAANTFALATFLSLVFRNIYFTIILIAWASVVSYSRIYLGLHYPLDIIVGSLIGVAYAFIFYFVANYILTKMRYLR